jgi:hypothetical protein
VRSAHPHKASAVRTSLVLSVGLLLDLRLVLVLGDTRVCSCAPSRFSSRALLLKVASPASPRFLRLLLCRSRRARQLLQHGPLPVNLFLACAPVSMCALLRHRSIAPA